jgi:hypothetical protein
VLGRPDHGWPRGFSSTFDGIAERHQEPAEDQPDQVEQEPHTIDSSQPSSSHAAAKLNGAQAGADKPVAISSQGSAASTRGHEP